MCLACVLGHGVEVTARGPQHTCSGPMPEERKSTSEHGLHAFIVGEMTEHKYRAHVKLV